MHGDGMSSHKPRIDAKQNFIRAQIQSLAFSTPSSRLPSPKNL